MKIGDFHFGGGSLCGKAHFVEKLTLWKSSALLGAWRFLLFLVLIGLVVLVGAVTWVGSDVIYYIDEDQFYYHNLSANVTGFDSDITFEFAGGANKINWTNSTGSFLVDSSVVSDWLFIANAITGNLTINAVHDNQTGFFIVPVKALNSTGDDTITDFEFQINATNDAPNFTNLNLTYDFPQAQGGLYTIAATDEEKQYPLGFNLTFINNCTHAAWSGLVDGENCSIFNLSVVNETAVNFNFSDPAFNDVGTYWANFSVSDFNGSCPHAYCNPSTYDGNKSSEIYLLKFNVYSSLTINASNCTGAVVMEGDTFNCTVNVTTRGETDLLDFSSLANLTSQDYVGDKSWFLADMTDSAAGFFYSLDVSVTPEKKQVGNWTIDVDVDDGAALKTARIELYVNYTESGVSLDVIGDLVGADALYDDADVYANATDEDLLIQDDTVKEEVLFFWTNDTRISVASIDTDHLKSYAVATLNVDHGAFMSSDGEGNYSINISVNDSVGNLDSKVFVVEILNETAPVWNLSAPVILNLTEDTAFSYNVSVNVSDPGENITFYYENVSAEFCSLNGSTFNSSSGMIVFTPTDCDVGYHNVSIIAGNGKLNSSHTFIFNVSNVLDVLFIYDLSGNNGTSQPLGSGSSFIASQGSTVDFLLRVSDDDFWIPLGQRADYYNESLNVSLTFSNSSGVVGDLFNFSFGEFSIVADNYLADYNASFTPGVLDVGNYTVFVNVSDASGNFVNRTWFLNVTESLDAPILGNVSNISLTIHDVLSFSLNATDDEDTPRDIDLNFSIEALDVGAPNLTVNGSEVYFNMSSNQSLSGVWSYNVTVNDSDGMMDSQVWNLSVYGYSWNVSVLGDFSLTENDSEVLNFTINHSVGDNLTYEFWIDDVDCWFSDFVNASNVTVSVLNCSYDNSSLRENVTGVGNGSVLGWDFLPNYKDETYGLLKNLTVRVYPGVANLSLNQRMSVATNFSFKVNISHANAPVVFYSVLGMESASTTNLQDISYNLSEYFSDADVNDPYYFQNLSLSVLSDSASNIDANGNRIPANFSQSGWSLSFTTGYTAAEFSEVVNVTVFDLDMDDNNITLTSGVSNNFELTFTIPTTRTTSSSSSTKTVVKFYSLRIIVPEDVIISDEDYIEIPFGLENSGTMDLKGIDLSSEVLYNNEFADDVSIDLGTTYVDELKAGERQDFTMKILADTDRSGKYKATLFANISSPKFHDWGDFFIDLRRTNESEAEELLIFTEKIIADNPECLELTEVFRRAKEAFEEGNDVEAMRIAEEVSAACEDAISANEQVRYRIEGFVERNFYYISFVTLTMFFVGFIFYVYKRVRFNKSVEDDYIK